MLLGVVMLSGLIAGIVITGLPKSVPSDVVRSEIRSSPSTTSTVVVTTSSSAVPTTSPVPSTSESPTTSTPITDPPTTTSPPPTTVGVTTTTLTPPPSVRVVVSNAGEADRLASRTGPVLRGLGYENLAITTATERQPTTIILFAHGMKAEARVLAAALGISAEQVRARPAGPITVSRDRGDLWLLVGAGRPPLIEAAMG